ncbi:MAG: PDZ domain-containing protein [Syntrophomonas sp.]|uniref:PDZ domain-containing protein n=1 Tax=Syntrophomonas sp. TaxID=2053627 RepID=UPI002606230D|nr:PDZ domain-containing protein [Syntrophomonas sp.]MDD2510212.1 PDZ domain-containing protein [Syntrophomonas sp.]MDD3879697.1 PDZ domain-containing protein [Syntrophomonas sp.]MDD4626491.1 PDZ domain-containing protein [Syntrophomonas sp.]
MEQTLAVLEMMGRVFVTTFTSPLFILIYLGLFMIVAWQYRRLDKLSGRILDNRRNSYWQAALLSSFLGLLGGGLGSILLVLLGINLNNIGISQLWLLAILLMFISPRFLCFAYAGGILSLFSLLTGYPQINIPHLMALIAVLHMVESLLILLDGKFQPTPVYVKKSGIVQGGFNLQKFWPIPLIALMGVGVLEPGTGVNMPDWWPLLKDYPAVTPDQTYALLPVLAILGYGEITTTTTPAQRIRHSAGKLFAFSLILLLLALGASRWENLTLAAALFSPLGHELVIFLGQQEERRKQPLYRQNESGVMVLDLLPGRAAARVGIKSQDIILSMNARKVRNLYDLEEEWGQSRGPVHLEILRGGKRIVCQLDESRGKELGIIAVPDHYSRRYLLLQEDNIFELLRRFWEKLKRLF